MREMNRDVIEAAAAAAPLPDGSRFLAVAGLTIAGEPAGPPWYQTFDEYGPAAAAASNAPIERNRVWVIALNLDPIAPSIAYQWVGDHPIEKGIPFME